MKNEDIQIETVTNSGLKLGMRITHMPSGISIKGTAIIRRNRLKGKLMRELTDKVKHDGVKKVIERTARALDTRILAKETGVDEGVFLYLCMLSSKEANPIIVDIINKNKSMDKIIDRLIKENGVEYYLEGNS